MATWTFPDGTELRSGGVVVGSGAFADEVRAGVHHARAEVQLYPIPMAKTPLDPTSDYLLGLFAHDVDRRVKTDYDPTIDDLPPGLLAKVIQFRIDQARVPYGRVF